MTLVDSDNNSRDNLAYGDFLYLFDTTTASAGDSVNTRHWNITVTDPTAYAGLRDSIIPNPVFGPFLNETAIIVNLTLTNATDVSYYETDVYHVIDGRKWIRPSYSVTPDFRNKSATNPIGTIQFSDSSDELIFPMAEITDWWWKITDDSGFSQNTSGWNNFTINMSNTDYYLVNLTVRNGQGNLASLTGYTGAPQDENGLSPSFAAVPVAGTAPLNVSFIDLSSGEITSWDWDFDFLGVDSTNPHTSQSQYPVHTYKKPGKYTVHLTIHENSLNVTLPVDGLITVYPPPVHLAVSPTKGEKPLNVTVISQSYGLNASPVYQWDFGNGTVVNTTTPSYVYTYNPGGVNPSQSWNYTVRHTVYSDGVAYPAQNTQNVTIETPAPPRARFAAVPQSGPAPLKVSFIDQSEGKEPFDYIWNFDDGKPNVYDVQNPIVIFDTPKEYNVTLFFKASNGEDLLYYNKFINVTAPAPPVIDFAVAPTKGTNPLNVTVIAQCTGLNESPVFEWDFGNGSKRATTDLSYVYQYSPFSPDSGTVWEWPINLTVYSNGTAYSALKSQNVTIHNSEKPKAAFNAYPRNGSVPLEVAFFDQSVGQEPIHYEWYFGDDTPKVLDKQNPVHVYENPGVYDVTLMIRAQNGQDIINQTKYITVSDHSAPIASFVPVPKSGPAPLNVAFVDTSIGDLVKWDWNFGDGNISNEKDPSNIYKYGNYLPILTVTDKDGVTNTTVGDVIRVYNPGDEYEKPVARFSYIIGDDNLTCYFTDESINVPTSRKWDFGDGNVSYDRNPVNHYSLFGTYTVTLTVSNPAGSSSAEQKIVLPAPAGDVTAGFTVSKTGTRTYKFTDSSTGPILAYYLSYGDGVIDTFKERWTSYHIYSKMGYYTAKLEVTNGKDSDIVTKKFLVP